VGQRPEQRQRRDVGGSAHEALERVLHPWAVRRLGRCEAGGHAIAFRFDFQSTVAIRIPKHKHPINDLLDLLGRRWALRILWELREGPLTFGRLRAACDDVSTSVLAQRLRELTDAGILGVDDAGAYDMTAVGRELSEQLVALDRWSRRNFRRQASP
jgi:DNA-binding HxlR family transcriptional regulator